jgi:hypothetical protein
MFGPPDLDDTERYPSSGTLEEKALFSLEQLRRQFYWHKRIYTANKEGGPQHTAALLAQGPKTAEMIARNAEGTFRSYLSQAYLTEDGETTDPKYPVDKMVNFELRRIRGSIINHVCAFMYYFQSMMPENVNQWDPGNVSFNLEAYRYRYANGLYEDINTVIPNKKMPPRSVSDLTEFLGCLALKYGTDYRHESVGPAFVVERLRDELIEFLLVDIPFNNKRLEAKTQLIADEVAPKPAEEKPILH